MNKTDLKHFKEKLEKELELLQNELKSVGRRNPSNPDDWEPIPEERDVVSADPNDKADDIEAYESNSAVLKQLEIQYNEVKNALKKIDGGQYGICEKCGKPIPKERLEANPSARFCVEHSK